MPIATLAFLFLSSPAHADALQAARLDRKLHAQVPLDAPFIDEAGRPVTLRALLPGDRPAVLALAYYGCSNLCGVVLNNMTEGLLQAPDLDPAVLVVSIDPHDVPPMAALRKRRYLTRLGRTQAPWHFLTGPEPSIRTLADTIGFRYAFDPATHQYAHAAALTILTPQGRVAGYLEGVGYPPAQLRAALNAAAKQQDAPAFQRFLMRCFHYDPADSRTGALVRHVLQAFGAATALALAGLVARYLRAERRGREA